MLNISAQIETNDHEEPTSNIPRIGVKEGPCLLTKKQQKRLIGLVCTQIGSVASSRQYEVEGFNHMNFFFFYT